MQDLADTVTYLQTVESTNNYAMARIHAGLARHGDAVLAFEQTAGKGQRGKQWLANPGENMLLSIIVEPKSLITQQFLLSAKVALACQGVFAELSSQKVFIKWPNDIYACDRKAGGILIENIMRNDEWRFAIVGIGLNINQVEFPEGLNGISLRELTQQKSNVAQVAREVCSRLNTSLTSATPSDEEVLQAYNALLYKRNETVRFRMGNVTLNAEVKGVNKWGELILMSGVEKGFKVGEVEWMVEVKDDLFSGTVSKDPEERKSTSPGVQPRRG